MGADWRARRLKRHACDLRWPRRATIQGACRTILGTGRSTRQCATARSIAASLMVFGGEDCAGSCHNPIASKIPAAADDSCPVPPVDGSSCSSPSAAFCPFFAALCPKSRLICLSEIPNSLAASLWLIPAAISCFAASLRAATVNLSSSTSTISSSTSGGRVIFHRPQKSAKRLGGFFAAHCAASVQTWLRTCNSLKRNLTALVFLIP